MASALASNRTGSRLAAKRIEELARSPESAIEPVEPSTPAEYSSDEALGFLCRNDFSRMQYQDIRMTSLQKGIHLYPSYNDVLLAKRKTYPTGIVVKPSCAEVPLQCLIDHTVRRLIEYLKIDALQDDSIQVIFKWGCDGSSNHSRYKQVFLDEGSDGELREYSDAHIFAVSLVPVRVVRRHHGSSIEEIMWSNDLPSSVTLCRPIKLIFSKENTEQTRTEVSKIYAEIKKLVPTTVNTGEIVLGIRTKLVLSMVDTKVVNDIAGTNSQQCYICLRSGKRLNHSLNAQEFNAPIILQHVFSPLHAQIRTMELLLNISYRLTLPKPSWRVSKDNKIVKDRQFTIRQAFKEKLGLRLNEPLPGGGNSNDGNTARRFFNEVDTVAEITGLDKNILTRFSILLKIINSNREIDANAFEKYATETHNLYCSLYNWYVLSPTAHKLLLHGSDIIRRAALPLGMLSEEAQETRNKCIRKFRERHSRKFSRTVNLEDVFKRLLMTSDPVISLTNRKATRNEKISELPQEANSMLLNGNI